MIHTVAIRRFTGWFCHIMEKHCQSQDLVRRNVLQCMNGMLAHRIPMMPVVLWRLHHNRKFRKHHIRDLQFIKLPHHFRMRGYKKFDQFHTNPFCTDLGKCGSQSLDCLFCRFLDLAVQLCCETHGAHHTKSIFLKPLHWISHAPQDMSFQIFCPVELIHQPGFIIVSHSIKGKISAP